MVGQLGRREIAPTAKPRYHRDELTPGKHGDCSHWSVGRDRFEKPKSKKPEVTPTMQGSLRPFRPAAVLLAAIPLAALAFPLAATEVYVPVLNPVTNDGARSETEVWVSNPGATAVSYAAL
jgi:hypothetical protein